MGVHSPEEEEEERGYLQLSVSLSVSFGLGAEWNGEAERGGGGILKCFSPCHRLPP